MHLGMLWLAACQPEGSATIEASCEPTDNALRQRCSVTVDPPGAFSIRYGPADGASPEREVESSSAEVQLSILRPETEYDFVVRALDGSVERSGSFRTDPLPPGLGSWLTVTGQSSVPLLGTEIPCSEEAYGVIYDTATGELVWYELLDEDGKLTPMDMIQFTEDHTVLGETSGRVVEVDLSGEVLLELVQGEDFQDELHHDLFKRDGRIYALRMLGGGGPPEPGSEPMFDGFYVFDAATGALVDEWDGPSSLPIPDDAEGDWMHTNTIWVDEGGDIYLSLYSQNSVLQLAADGTLQWVLAGEEPAGLGNDYTLDWGSTPRTGFVQQHAVSRLPDGTLVLLDNAHGRALTWSLDEEARTATLLAEYPAGEPMCGPQGTAAVTSSGNILVGCLSGMLQEYTPQGSVAWTASVRGCADRPIAARYYPLEGW
jgi:hypothetical protein